MQTLTTTYEMKTSCAGCGRVGIRTARLRLEFPYCPFGWRMEQTNDETFGPMTPFFCPACPPCEESGPCGCVCQREQGHVGPHVARHPCQTRFTSKFREY